MLFEVKRDGTYVDFVPGSETEPLVPPEAFIGKKVSEVMPPEVAKLQMELIEQALRTGETQTSEIELTGLDGSQSFETRFVVSKEDEVLVIAPRHHRAQARREGAPGERGEVPKRFPGLNRRDGHCR